MDKEQLLSESRRLCAVFADQKNTIFLKDCSIACLKAGKYKLTSKLMQLCKDSSFVRKPIEARHANKKFQLQIKISTANNLIYNHNYD